MKELERNYLVFSIILNKSTMFVHFYALINSGDFIISFIDANFAILYFLSL